MSFKNLKPRLRHSARVTASILFMAPILAYSGLFSAAASAQSAATQQFFGFSGGGGGGGGLPASCDITEIKNKVAALEDQLRAVNDNATAKINQINQEQSQLKPGDTAGGAALDAEQQQVLDDAASQRAAIKAQEEVYHQQSMGPSDQCKADLIASTVADMRNTYAFVTGGGPATLARVNSVIAEIESLIPKLGSAGVNSRDINTVKVDVAHVKGDVGTMGGFFNAMASQASAFIARATANPVGTYNSMQGGGGGLTVSGGAGAAADDLVSSFTSLVTLFDKLSNTTVGQ